MKGAGCPPWWMVQGATAPLPGPTQVVGISRIRWSLSPGLGGRFAPESVVAFSRPAHWRALPAAVAGVLVAYYGIAVAERLLPRPWLRRFQRQFGNPGGELMASLPGWILLETTGRRSGAARQVPVGGRLIADSVWIVAADPGAAAYVRNIEVNPRVRVMIQGHWRGGIAHLLADDKAHRRMFQINPLNGLFIGIAGRDHLTIRVQLDDAST